jgi:hypothetical protein
MSDAKQNKLFQRGYEPEQKKSATNAWGMFFELSEVEQETIILVGIRDAPATRAKSNDAILAQDTAQQRKEELAKEKGMEQAREEFIEGLYYHQMYFSDACWKDDQIVVA